MSFVERLRQAQVLEKQRVEQRVAQEKLQQEVREREIFQRQALEKERRAKRREPAEKFREEIGASLNPIMGELAKFLSVPIETTVEVSVDGMVEYETQTQMTHPWTGGLEVTNLTPRDPDSVFDTLSWDVVSQGFRGRNRTDYYEEKFSEKYIAVETCPDGTIIFHAGWGGSTKLGLAEWRREDRKQIFDRALEKAYKHPGGNTFYYRHEIRQASDSERFGVG